MSLSLPGSFSLAQQIPPDVLVRNLENSRAALEQIEDSIGISNVRLLESLEQLAESLIALNLYVEAHGVLDRAIQITRANEGLFTPMQRDLQVRKIENLIFQRDWESARAGMEHLNWLYVNKSLQIDAELIDDLFYLSELHIRGIGEDFIGQQSTHFRKAATLNWAALNLAKALWGEHDPRLSPMAYRLVKQYHAQLVALERGERISIELREVVPGSGWVRERKAVKQAFYLLGIQLLNQIKNIHANAEPPDRQGMAMADLYIGDWQVIFSRANDAKLSYSEGYAGLQAAGVDKARIDEFFVNPIVLPEADFYAAVDVALLARSPLQEGGSRPDVSTVPDSIQFSEWSRSFPHTQSPLADQYADLEESARFALYSFSLSGLNGYSRWINSSYRTGVGMARELQVLDQFTVSPEEERALLGKLQTLRFRPTFVDGVAQSTSGTLRYNLAVE